MRRVLAALISIGLLAWIAFHACTERSYPGPLSGQLQYPDELDDPEQGVGRQRTVLALSGACDAHFGSGVGLCAIGNIRGSRPAPSESGCLTALRSSPLRSPSLEIASARPPPNKQLQPTDSGVCAARRG